MSEQPAKEWDEMNEKTQNEIADRLHSVIADAERADLRARLARASRPARRFVEMTPVD